MKKFYIIMLCLLLIVAHIINGCFVYLRLTSVKRELKSWQPEIEEHFVDVLYESVYFDSQKLCIGDYSERYTDEVFCIYENRIYFFYSSPINDSFVQSMWHIASIDINSKDIQVHFSGDLSSLERSEGYDYRKLSYYLGYQNSKYRYGGFYQDNQIYLHGSEKTIVYNVLDGTTSEIEQLPISKYEWKIENDQRIYIEDTETHISREITLESMAEKNVYAKKLLEMSDKKIWDGDSATKNFFDNIKIINDEIYLVCCVLNWHGESFAVLFKYDFATDTVFYVSYEKVVGGAMHNYNFVPVISVA